MGARALGTAEREKREGIESRSFSATKLHVDAPGRDRLFRAFRANAGLGRARSVAAIALRSRRRSVRARGKRARRDGDGFARRWAEKRRTVQVDGGDDVNASRAHRCDVRGALVGDARGGRDARDRGGGRDARHGVRVGDLALTCVYGRPRAGEWRGATRETSRKSKRTLIVLWPERTDGSFFSPPTCSTLIG